MLDIHGLVKATSIIMPIAVGANATKTGIIIDRSTLSGSGGVEFLCSYGAVTTTGTVVTPVVLEGDVTGTMTSVADADLLGTELLASLTATTPRTSGTTKNVAKRVGYRGGKRYVRCDIVSTGTTSVGCVSVVALLHSVNIAPVSNP